SPSSAPRAWSRARRCSSTRISREGALLKLQTGTRLGLYAVLELARYPDRTLSAADLAERFGVSSHHLAKVLRTLGAAGLVRGGRGACGGADAQRGSQGVRAAGRKNRARRRSAGLARRSRAVPGQCAERDTAARWAAAQARRRQDGRADRLPVR